MSNYRRINNDTSVVVVGRTAPVTPGQQAAADSLPVVLATDQPPIPVEEQNKVQSEVALSLLGIPRAEVALGIFADVNTYDVNPSEWSSSPVEKKQLTGTSSFELSGITSSMSWGLTHIPDESGALIEAPPNKTAVLTSKRFFRYQPGRVSAATFGVKSSVTDNSAIQALAATPTIPDADVRNPPLRKYGIFDNYDGYYWETRGTGIGDQFCVVRRTQSLIKRPIVPFGSDSAQQQEDHGIVGTGVSSPTIINTVSATVNGNILSILKTDITPVNSIITKNMIPYLSGGNYNFPPSTTVSQVIDLPNSINVYLNNSLDVATLNNIQFSFAGDLVVVRDGLLMTHAAMYDNSLLKDPTTINIIACNVGNSTFTLSGNSGLKLGQLVRFDRDIGSSNIIDTNSLNTYVFKVESISKSGNDDVVTLRTLEFTEAPINVIPTTNASGLTGVYLKTPVPFIFPKAFEDDTNTAADIMFPLRREFGINKNNGNRAVFNNIVGPQGAIDTAITAGNTIPSFRGQIDNVNTGITCFDYTNTEPVDNGVVDGWRRWILDNVKPQFYGVYEYRVPRSRFSADFLDVSKGRSVVYSDVVRTSDGTGGDVVRWPGQTVLDETGGRAAVRDSVWNMDFGKVTMNKIEFSWYGAVGALFLAYVPVSNNEARWVRIHHLRASNQLKVASLGNATLPITYNVYGGGTEKAYGVKDITRAQYIGGDSASEFITKYGASYYIDGGDRGTVRLFNYAQDNASRIYTSSFTLIANTLSADGRDTNRGPYIVTSSDKINDMFMYASLSSSNIPNNNTKVAFIEQIPGSSNSRVYLSRIGKSGSALDSITFTVDSPQIIYGVTSKTDIVTSTGFKVRNRIQVYPTKLSTGLVNSNSIISLRLLKNCTFQTPSVYTWNKPIRVDSVSNKPDISTRRLNPAGLTTVINQSLSSTGGATPSNGSIVYGWFRVYNSINIPSNHFTLFGELAYNNSLYEFTPKQSYTGDVYLLPDSDFLIAKNYNEKGENLTSGNVISDTEEIERLSSVLVDLTNRRPIPGTGTEISNFFISNGSEIYDLNSYFDYNKDYISFPLTDIPDNLYLVVKTTLGSDNPEIACSLTWEEQ
jgi:hypothetical protein